MWEFHLFFCNHAWYRYTIYIHLKYHYLFQNNKKRAGKMSSFFQTAQWARNPTFTTPTSRLFVQGLNHRPHGMFCNVLTQRVAPLFFWTTFCGFGAFSQWGIVWIFPYLGLVNFARLSFDGDVGTVPLSTNHSGGASIFPNQSYINLSYLLVICTGSKAARIVPKKSNNTLQPPRHTNKKKVANNPVSTSWASLTSMERPLLSLAPVAAFKTSWFFRERAGFRVRKSTPELVGGFNPSEKY